MSPKTKIPPHKKSVVEAKKKVKVRKKPQEPAPINWQGRKKKRTGPKLTPEEKAARDAKQRQALELRMAGTTYAQIAQAVGYASPGAAKNACDAALSKVEIDAAKDVVAMDLARLDEFQMRCTHALRQNGDLGQIDRILRLMEWRYKLLGVTDETVRALQSDNGIHTTVNNKNNVMVVQAAPETESDFIAKMMKAVGVDPSSDEAQSLMRQYNLNAAEGEERDVRALPMLEGSANSERDKAKENAEEIVEAEIVEDE